MFLLRIAQALDAGRVPYAVAGGYAVALHGAVRGTVDVDIVLHLRQDDYEKAEAALRSIGLVSRLPISASDVIRFREEYMKNRNLLAWSFWNPANATEILDVLIGEDLAQCKVKRMTVRGVAVRVLAIDDLIRLKQRAARPQDLADIDALQRLRRS